MSSSDVSSEELSENIATAYLAAESSVADIASIDCIPDEILEYILSLTSPYCDFKSALQVSKRWYSVIKSMYLEFIGFTCTELSDANVLSVCYDVLGSDFSYRYIYHSFLW